MENKERRLMEIDPDAPGWLELLRGNGDRFMVRLARFGSLAIAFLVVLQFFIWMHI